VINALQWNDELVSGQVQQMKEIADKNGVGQRYIAQIIKLAKLSPVLIRRILDGNIPHDMTLGKLKIQIPLGWDEQASLFQRPGR